MHPRTLGGAAHDHCAPLVALGARRARCNPSCVSFERLPPLVPLKAPIMAPDICCPICFDPLIDSKDAYLKTMVAVVTDCGVRGGRGVPGQLSRLISPSCSGDSTRIMSSVYWQHSRARQIGPRGLPLYLLGRPARLGQTALRGYGIMPRATMRTRTATRTRTTTKMSRETVPPVPYAKRFQTSATSPHAKATTVRTATTTAIARSSSPTRQATTRSTSLSTRPASGSSHSQRRCASTLPTSISCSCAVRGR